MTYDRDVLVECLVYHQTLDGPPPFTFTCACGWRELGASHAEHVADVVESSLRVRST